MLKIDRKNQKFSCLEKPTLADVSITERYDLQEFISNSPSEFFREIGQELFLLAKEIEPSETVQDRVDLLALDKEGKSVIVELKRGSNKLHMLQAISYAGMISQWESDDFFELLDASQQEMLENFLDIETEDINRQQRIILVAEAYDYALLVAAKWLSETHNVDIICCKIAIARDSVTNSEYLVCSNVYPAPEIAQQAASRGRRGGIRSKTTWADWDSALSGILNTSVISYFKREIGANRESYLPKRILRFRLDGKRRWFMAARSKNAYVWQQGRFKSDLEFWQQGLNKAGDVKLVKDGQCLRMFLSTDSDFRFFHDAVTGRLNTSEWQSGPTDEGEKDSEFET